MACSRCEGSSWRCRLQLGQGPSSAEDLAFRCLPWPAKPSGSSPNRRTLTAPDTFYLTPGSWSRSSQRAPSASLLGCLHRFGPSEPGRETSGPRPQEASRLLACPVARTGRAGAVDGRVSRASLAGTASGLRPRTGDRHVRSTAAQSGAGEKAKEHKTAHAGEWCTGLGLRGHASTKRSPPGHNREIGSEPGGRVHRSANCRMGQWRRVGSPGPLLHERELVAQRRDPALAQLRRDCLKGGMGHACSRPVSQHKAGPCARGSEPQARHGTAAAGSRRW